LKGISTKDWKTGHPVSLISALPLLLALSLTPNAAGAAMEKPARTQGQMDVKVIHVDKWGVYVPNIVFYWDADMGKQKIAGLTATAEKLRNKLATIVYSVQGEIEKDKRPLVVDIAPLKEQPSIQPYEQPPVDESGNPIQGYGDGPKVYPTELLDDGLSYDAETSVDGRDGQDQSQLAAMDLTDPDSLPLVRDKPLPASSNTMVINKREVQMLVEHILHLTEKKSLDSLLYYYGDQVNYYGRGEVTKDYIRKDMGYYFKNWDTIACTLASDVVVVDTDRPDTKVVRFTSRYAVENPRKSLAGQTDNTWKVQRTATGLKVIDQKQSIIRSQP
jgi:hypothetical protein